MNVRTTVGVARGEIKSIASIIYALAIRGQHNIDIVLEDLMEMDDEDFAEYEQQLRKTADIVGDLHRLKKICAAVNVLTDPVFSDANRSEEYILCENCPCHQCQPDSAVFQAVTGDAFIPPRKYCRKAFLELRVAGYLRSLLGIQEDWHDIDENDWFKLKLLQKGSEFIAVQTEG